MKRQRKLFWTEEKAQQCVHHEIKISIILDYTEDQMTRKEAMNHQIGGMEWKLLQKLLKELRLYSLSMGSQGEIFFFFKVEKGQISIATMQLWKG